MRKMYVFDLEREIRTGYRGIWDVYLAQVDPGGQ